MRFVLIALLVVGCGALTAPAGPVTADLPPVGTIWFGRSFDPATFQVRLRLNSVGANETFVMVGHLPRVVPGSQVVLRAYLDGQLVANQASNVADEGDVFGFNLGPLGAPGEWRYEIADIGGNVLARGTIVAQ